MINTNEPNLNSLNEENKHPLVKKPYHAPTITLYGSVTNLVKGNPGTGGDGATTWADCTLT